MQPAPGPLSEQPQGDAPLPPVLTHHPSPVLPADAERLAAPFVAGAPRPDGGAREWPLKPLEAPQDVEPDVGATPVPAPGESLPWADFLPVGAPLDLPEGETAAWVTPRQAEGGLPATAEPWAAGELESAFPLDAFIRPEGEPVLPPVSGGAAQRELADAAAERLEALAARLRAEGFSALLQPGSDARQVDLLIASLLAGYVAR